MSYIATLATRIGRLVPSAACAFSLLGATALQAAESVVRLESPNEKVAVTIRSGDRLTYAVLFNENAVIEPSTLGVIVDGKNLGTNVAVTGDVIKKTIDEKYPIRGGHAMATNHGNSALIPLTGGDANTPWQLEVRVYDDGVAYRYIVPGTGERTINGEVSEWKIPTDSTFWYQSDSNRSYEDRYRPGMVGKIPPGTKLMAPAAVKFPRKMGYGLMTEANLVNYSDMSLEISGKFSFVSIFHDDTKGWKQSGEITSPWRVMILAADLNTLVNSDMIQNLCPPPPEGLFNAPWIRPGRSIWHWLTGGSPKLEEQHTWIDGARDLGYEYYLVDDGWKDWNGGGEAAWSALADVIQYAKSQNVDIWAWVHARYVHKPEERVAYFQHAKSIGLVGLKIDFPDPANSQWVQWYDDVLKDAAAANLMIDFHGALKPTGRERTWPHEMTREAIAGREQGKNPSVHDTTLPFLRYVQGHADYTPTLFDPSRLSGSSLAHELSMAIIYTSPYLCMGDNPSRYLQSEAVDVIKALPAVWDETIVLPGSEIGQQASFARRKGDQWFIGVLNDKAARDGKVSLSFLPDGEYKIVELADKVDQDAAFQKTERTVTNRDSLRFPLRSDGGYVAWLTKSKGN